ncbi:MAG TPA: substrate-binding domain-containing protein [Kribbella sp.]|jgi:ABC-type phosphate transport system substrate-binding protein
MRLTRSITAAAIALSTIALATTVVTTTASADPAFVPDANDIVGVGSDTTQYLLNDLATAYNSHNPQRRLASFNATGSASIRIRATVTIARPDGSGAGIKALSARTDIDFARSSRAKKSTDPTNLAFLRYAKDQVRWMGNAHITRPRTLSKAQLSGIYNCRIRNWRQLGGPNLAIVPLVPQAGSGTRSFWADQVGFNGTTLPSCVKDKIGTKLVQEHDPAAVRSAGAGAIAPVSYGRWVKLSAAQKSGVFIGGITNPDVTKFNRDVFNVVKTNAAGVIAPFLADLFGNGRGTTSTGSGLPWICKTEAQPIIKRDGLTPLAAGVCGTK